MKTPLRFTFLAVMGVLAGAAQAHHPQDGAMPVTAVEGLLSGLAHPVIGLDHLLFLLAAASLLGLSRLPAGRALWTLGLLVAASLVGSFLRVPGVALPLLELLVSASLLAAAAGLWRRRVLAFGPAGMVAAAAAGFLHGQAYGEAVVGAEASPVFWYLLGLMAVQCGLLLVVFGAVRRAALLQLPQLRAGVMLLGTVVGAAGAGFMGLALLG